MANQIDLPWAAKVRRDIGDVNFINVRLHDPRIQQGKEFKSLIREMFQKNYGYNIDTGVPFLATVLKVLDPGWEGPKTTATRMVDPNNYFAFNAKTIRVIARIPELDAGVNWPKSLNDGQRMSAHGEYIATGIDAKFEGLQAGSEIWVQLRGTNTQPTDGAHAGMIIGVAKEIPDLLPRLKDLKRAKKLHKPDCKAKLELSGPTAKFLVGHTDAKPNVQNPVIRKYKTMIKAGIYGNGTPQTKFHFNAAISSTGVTYEDSFHHSVPGAAPGKNNAFIWVGHLRNNGYLDLLDRPITLGRETIIYAPITLNVNAPIELKYYFHDRGGFGHAWVHGPNTETEQSINNANKPKNDFREKIAPAIKDLIKDKRNFILVIPEMSYSRGYGTSYKNVQRAQKLASGKKVALDAGGTAKLTMRTMVHPAAVPSVKKYLQGLPTSKIISYGFLGLEEASIENVLQKTHLRERESVTFDGSYTGGKFGDFHTEVLQVVNEHIGMEASSNIDHVSIIADGLGGINLASVVRNMPLSSVHNSAEVSFKSVTIDRIDFVENGQDTTIPETALFTTFVHGPAHTIYSDYLLERAENPRPFEFNYITEANTTAGTNFFKKIGAELEFEKANKSGVFKSNRRFSKRINQSLNPQAVVSMHTVPLAVGGGTKRKIAYTFAAQNDTVNTSVSSLLVPDNNLFLSPSIDTVSDHAALVASRAAAGRVVQYIKEKEEIVNKIETFEDMLVNHAMSPSTFCDPSAGKDTFNACRDGTFHADLLKEPFLNYLKDMERYFELHYLIPEEELIAKYTNRRDKLQFILNDPDNGISKKHNTIKKNNSNSDYFLKFFPLGDENSFFIRGNSNNMNQAAKLFTSKWKLTSREAMSYPVYLNYLGSRSLTPLAGLDNISSTIAWSGFFRQAIAHIGQEKALNTAKETLKNAINAAAPQSGVPPTGDDKCESPVLTLRALQTTIPSPAVWDPNAMRIEETACAGREIRVVSNYEDLKKMIPWDVPKKSEIISKSHSYSPKKTGLADVGKEVFQVKKFKYKARGPNNATRQRESPPVWTCMSNKIAEAWNAACNVSGYVPFRITSGVKGYDKSGDAIAYQKGMSIDAFGLSINVDDPITGYGPGGDPIYSVFTGMWTPRFVERHTDELYDLGVLYHDPRGPLGVVGLGALTDSGSRYKDNAYQGWFERELREAQNWKSSEDAYNGTEGITGPGSTDEPHPDYDKIMKAASGSPIVPPGANPVQWLLTFCEKSGMKWGNSFFLRKRFRGRKTGTLWFRDDAPAWDLVEQNRLAAIYGIPDIVARINAISWPVQSFDKHMHFQFYSGDPVIKWEDIPGTLGKENSNG